eukprot:351893-Chlamydomonas_euryale.AAC.25
MYTSGGTTTCLSPIAACPLSAGSTTTPSRRLESTKVAHRKGALCGMRAAPKCSCHAAASLQLSK